VAFCSKCGVEIKQGSAFCQNCGAPAPGAAAPPPQPAAGQPVMAQAGAVQKTNSLAIVSLVLGIVSFLINPVFLISIAAVIVGFIANNQISKNPGFKGKGLAMGGIILGILSVILTIVLIIVAGSLFGIFGL